MSDPRALSAAPDPMVSVDWLADRLAAPDVRVLDATWRMPGDPRDPRAGFLDARIPGAVFFDIDEIADLDSALPHMAPSPVKFAARMRRMGVGDGQHIVVYDADGLFSAARAWWLFRHMGVNEVSVLDGGLPAWIAAGQPVDSGPRQPPQERHFTARLRSDLVRTFDEVKALSEARGQIVDARSVGRFAGTDPEPRPGLRGGHIPGSRNVPFGACVGPDGRLKEAAALAQVFADAGVDTARATTCTCGSGVTAAVIALALARLGRWDAAIYDGSWAEWGGRADAPVALSE